MRFVPHHLADPPVAFAEAMRVCRSGFLVAEPWFDTSFASQRTALELDGWLKRQHRRDGMVHEEVLDANALVGALPRANHDIHVDTSLRLRSRSLDDVGREVTPLRDELPSDHPDRAALAELLDTMEHDGVSWLLTL